MKTEGLTHLGDSVGDSVGHRGRAKTVDFVIWRPAAPGKLRRPSGCLELRVYQKSAETGRRTGRSAVY